MSTDHTADAAATRDIKQPGSIQRIALVGCALAAVAGAFAFLGGWFSPHLLTPARFTDGFQEVYGDHPGFRRNHAKGVCVSGYFESNGNGQRLSKAAVFRPGRIPVIGRFSLGGGNPNMADAPNAARGMGLEFSPPEGEIWRTAMVNLPVFPFPTPEAFYGQMLASKPDPKTGQADPAKMQEFLAIHPEAVRALAIVKSKPPSSGFDNTTFFGLNAFLFTNGAGSTTPVRWLLKPEQPITPADETSTHGDNNYLFDDLIEAINHKPLQWRLFVVLGQAGDPTNDSSLPWPADREQVDVGTLTLDRIESDDTSPAKDITFDPLILPDGMSPSDDPLLSARSAVYSQSYTRRAGEPREPSPITPAEVLRSN